MYFFLFNQNKYHVSEGIFVKYSFTLNLNITTEYNKLNVPKEDFYFDVKCKMVMIFFSVSCMF